MAGFYEKRLARGELKPDPAQRSVAERLEDLRQRLQGHAPAKPNGFLGRLLARPADPPKGVYLWGGVGRGKTMLMDLFFDAAPVTPKRRVHFHAFMQDVHGRLHGLRKQHAAEDAMGELVQALAAEAALLCLDEMQIADIADAMIVGRLFTGLIERGTVVVATSNLPPDRLYEDGLNRQLFLPFVQLLVNRLDIVSLGGATDYRLGRIKAYESFVTPLGPEADRRIQALWERLTDTARGTPGSLAVQGRSLLIPQAARDVARFDFAALCEQPLGPADYLALAAAYRTLFIERIPRLAPEQRNAAKRFVVLIDTLYDAHTHLVASSAAPPEAIYPQGDHSAEFARTASRLQEMQSASWWGGTIVET